MGEFCKKTIRRALSRRFALEVSPLEARSLITESLGVAYSMVQLGSYRVGFSLNATIASISSSSTASSVPRKLVSGRSPRGAVVMPLSFAQVSPVAAALNRASLSSPEPPMDADPTGNGFVASPSITSPGGGRAAHAPVGGAQAPASPAVEHSSSQAPEAENPTAGSASAVPVASVGIATSGSGLNTPVAGQNTSAFGTNNLAPASAPVSIALASSYAGIAPTTTRRPVATPMLSSLSFTNFPLYALDYNNGETLLPGASQYANLNGYVDLRAQTKSATGVTFSWNTSGLTDAKNITGANTYRLRFQWKNFSSGATDTVSVTATDSGGHQETQTYSFLVPSGSVFPWGSSPTYTWPETVSPDLALANTARFESQNLSVDAYSGSVQTAIALPSYNPNVAPLVFSYDSLNADPRPMILEHHELDPSQSVPSKVGAQLTFNSSTGTTYNYDTSVFSGGDILQVALQANATSLSTGRYDYSVAVSDLRSSTTTTTASGTMTVLNGLDFPTKSRH